MEEQKDMFGLLDLMIQPVFCVKDNIIIRANPSARKMFLEAGQSIQPLLDAGADAYATFSGGCLYLPLTIAGQTMGASVRRMGEMDVFELDCSDDSSTLRAMALAAGILRKPLSGALANTASLLETHDDPETAQQLSQLNRELHQILRQLGNMSDAESLCSRSRQETVNLTAFFREIFEKAQVLASRAGIQLHYDGLKTAVYSLADKGQLERAVLNILSNAMKFTPKGEHIDVSLVCRGRILALSVQDSGCGIHQDVLGSLFQRYLRQPCIEDSRFGLGLGLRLVHAAALHHGGTLLLTQSETGGTRVVLTLAIRQNPSATMRSPIFEIDYTGGIDHSLVELSDCLPAELFDGCY